MPLEAELKFRVEGFARVKEALREAGAELVSPESHERNAVLDNDAGEVGRSGMLLRVREYRGEVTVTVKEPLMEGPVKKRAEHELKVNKSFADAVKLFGAVGCHPVYEYTKKREVWKLGAAVICLDTLHHGTFVEIEAGNEEAVFRAAELLGFSPGEGLKESYAALEARLRFSNS
jgi:predicted adenylyl cyclase CyaB